MTQAQRDGFKRLRQLAEWFGERGAELMIEAITDGLDHMGYDGDDEGMIFEACGLAREELWAETVAKIVLQLHDERPFPLA